MPKSYNFCQSIPHAENILKLLRGFEKWKNSAILHSGLNKLDRKLALMNFRKDDCSILVAVDILNEGIDVPNVNIILFCESYSFKKNLCTTTRKRFENS